MAFYDNVMNHATPLSSVEEAVKHMAFIQQLIDAAQ
jgi:hypothetical protein